MKYLLIPLLFSRLAMGEDFEALRARLKIREQKITEHMARLGVAGSSMQSGKTNSSQDEKGVSLFKVHGALTRTLVPAGSLFFGTLRNRLVVGGENSPVIVDLSPQNKFGQVAGLKLLGLAHQSSTDGRVALDFDRLILSSGKIVSLEGIGLDESGALGLEAQVFSSKALLAAGALASSFVSGFASAQQSRTTSNFGFSEVKPSGRNGLLQGVAETAATQAKNFIDKETQEKPVLVLNEGTAIAIFLNKEVRL